MRWRFPEPLDEKESQARAQVIARMDAWWRAFAARTADLTALFRQEQRWDLPGFMRETLGAVEPQLMWEFGPGLRGGHRLVITPESHHHLRPLVDALLRRAPELPGWELYPHRVAEGLEAALATVEGRAGIDLAPFRVTVRETGDGGVDLVYWTPQLARLDVDRTREAAFVATEALLGEPALDTVVDGIEVADRPGEGEDLPLASLSAAVEARVAAQLAVLSPAPLTERIAQAGQTVWRLQPKDATDWPGQRDLMVVRSAVPAVWKRAHARPLFVSARFSRFGETFAYLKLDGSDGRGGISPEARAELEDALGAALGPDRLGAVIGGGTGRRYVYLDLALGELDRAIPRVREGLRHGRAPRRSWLLFFDSALGDEWVGIWDDTPPPPA